MKKVLLVLLSIVMLLSSCSLDQNATGTGTLSLVIGNTVSRSIDPGISMVTSYYLVSGSLNGGSESFTNERATGTSYTREVSAGTWTISVDAYNSDDTHIGTGSAELTVKAGGTNSCTVTVNELSGTGSLTVSINVTGTTSGLTATVSTYGGASSDTKELTSSGASVYTGTFDSLANGYYMLQIMDGDALVGITTFRIVNGSKITYSGIYEVDSITGGIIIVDNVKDTATVSIQMDSTTFSSTSTLSATAVVSDSGTYSYSWLLNNVPIVTESASNILSYDLSTASYTEGTYTLQVIATATDGTMCDATAEVTITVDPDVAKLSEVLYLFNNVSADSTKTDSTASGTITFNNTELTTTSYSETGEATTTTIGTITTSESIAYKSVGTSDNTTATTVMTMSGAFTITPAGATTGNSYVVKDLNIRLAASSDGSMTIAYVSATTFTKDGVEVAEADRDTECTSLLMYLTAALQANDTETMTISDYSGSATSTRSYNCNSTVTGYESYTLVATVDSTYTSEPPTYTPSNGKSTAKMTITDDSGNVTSLVIEGTFYYEVSSVSGTMYYGHLEKSISGVTMNETSVSVTNIAADTECNTYVLSWIGIW